MCLAVFLGAATLSMMDLTVTNHCMSLYSVLHFYCYAECYGTQMHFFPIDTPSSFRSQYFRPFPKIKILLPAIFCPDSQDSKTVLRVPVGQKQWDRMNFEEKGSIWLMPYHSGRVTSDPCQKLPVILIISSTSAHFIKSYSTFSGAMAHRCPPL